MQLSVRRPLQAALVAFVTLASAQTFAATIASTADGDWATGATWVGGVAPGAGDDAVILHNVTLGAAADITNVSIQAGSLSQTAAVLTVTGDFALAGGTYSTTGTPIVRFAGSGLQTISGSPAFYELRIANTAAAPDDLNAVVTSGPISTSGELLIQGGQLSLASGSTINNISISSGAILKPSAGATIEVTGASGVSAFSCSGTLTANSSLFRFTGASKQIVFGATFYDVEAASTAAVPDDSNDVQIAGGSTAISNSLLISDGQAIHYGQANNVTIGANGILKVGSGGKIAGNLTNTSGGTTLGNNALLTLNGTGPQLLDGPITISGLYVQNTAAVPSDTAAVTTSGGLTTTANVIVASGQFSPTTGDSFRNFDLNGGTLKPTANSTIVVSGKDSGGKSIQGAGGTLVNNGATFRFTSSTGGAIYGTTLENVEILNSAASPGDANAHLIGGGATVTNLVTVSDGQLNLSGQVNDVTVGANGTFKPLNSGNIAGDITNTAGGTVAAASGSFVTINGTGAQLFDGPITFSTITISNTAAAPDDSTAVTTTGALTVSANLNVSTGQFTPTTGDTFGTIALYGGILKPASGATIVVNGELSGIAFNRTSGTLTPNGSTFKFTGQDQAVHGGTFYNVEVASPAATPSTSNDVFFTNGSITNLLTVTDGMATSLSQMQDVVVGADGIFNLYGFGSECKVAGNLTNTAGGSVSAPAATIMVFNGSGSQTISGPANFAVIRVDNTAPTPSDSAAVVTTGGVTASEDVFIEDGQFSPANGGSFRDIFVASNGILKPAAGATISIAGSNGGTALNLDSGGVIDANGGTIRFTGSGMQGVYGIGTLYNVDVANTAATPSLSAHVFFPLFDIAGTLHVSDGMASIMETVGNIQVDADGILDFYNGSDIAITGNLTNVGSVIKTGSPTVAFSGGVVQNLTTNSPIPFFTLNVASGTTLNENGSADSTATFVNNSGTIRRTLAVAGTGPLPGGLTAASVDVTTQGTLASLVIDRIDSIPNAGAGHVGGKSWTFDVAGATGYTASLTLPHSLGTPANAAVAKYLGTGTNWYYAQDSSTASTVTRTGLTDLSSVWAAADFTTTAVREWQLLAD